MFSLSRWYQIKITLRWEDDDYTSLGTPARVVQYEGVLFVLKWLFSLLLSITYLVLISVCVLLMSCPELFEDLIFVSVHLAIWRHT